MVGVRANFRKNCFYVFYVFTVLYIYINSKTGYEIVHGAFCSPCSACSSCVIQGEQFSLLVITRPTFSMIAAVFDDRRATPV